MSKEYSVIGTSTFPLLENGYLIPYIECELGCFALASHERGFVSKEDFRIASQNCQIVQFESSDNAIISKEDAEFRLDYMDDRLFPFPYYIMYWSNRTIEKFLKDYQLPDDYRLLKPLPCNMDGIAEYSFYLAPTQSTLDVLDYCFVTYKTYIEGQIKKGVKENAKYKEWHDKLDVGLACLKEAATSKEKNEETMVLRFVTNELFEQEDQAGTDEWIIALGNVNGFSYSLEEWKERIAKKRKELGL